MDLSAFAVLECRESRIDLRFTHLGGNSVGAPAHSQALFRIGVRRNQVCVLVTVKRRSCQDGSRSYLRIPARIEDSRSRSAGAAQGGERGRVCYLESAGEAAGNP